jgi:hypothetical protein
VCQPWPIADAHQKKMRRHSLPDKSIDLPELSKNQSSPMDKAEKLLDANMFGK